MKQNLRESSNEVLNSNEFMQMAYRLATSGDKSAKKRKWKVLKLKGKATMQGNKASLAVMVKYDPPPGTLR